MSRGGTKKRRREIHDLPRLHRAELRAAELGVKLETADMMLGIRNGIIARLRDHLTDEEKQSLARTGRSA